MEPTMDGDAEQHNEPYPPNATHDYAAPPEMPYPLFCKVIFIVDACFSGLRAILVPFAFIGLFVLHRQNSPLFGVSLYDTVASTGILVFGLSASIALLLRKRWGMLLATLALLATLCSIGLGLWQASIQAGTRFQATAPSAERIGFMLGAGCVIVFRFALLVLYLIALFRFERWSSKP